MHPFTAAYIRRLTTECWSTISYIVFSTQLTIFHIAFSFTYCCLSCSLRVVKTFGAFSICRRSSTAAAAAGFDTHFSTIYPSNHPSIYPSIQATGKPDRFEGEISFEPQQRCGVRHTHRNREYVGCES